MSTAPSTSSPRSEPAPPDPGGYGHGIGTGWARSVACWGALALIVAACSGDDELPPAPARATSTTTAPPATTTTTTPPTTPATTTTTAVPAGNPDSDVALPAEAQPADTSQPDRVIGNGTPASCTSDAVVAAVAAGGVITFSCGPAPVTITLEQTAKIRNDTGPEIVLDGGGKVTLSGGGQRRILYLNTCDEAQVWTTSHCQDQDHPRLTVQNLTFVDGNATGQLEEGGGGGAIFARGGRLKVVASRFLRNRCDETGPDLGGVAIRVLSQSQGQPVYIAQSTFQEGVCSNGGALSSIGVSWVVIDSLMTQNSAIGWGANPAKGASPGGGSGGAIYTDGNLFTVRLVGSRLEDNHAKEGGGAVFFVSNDRSGTMDIEDSVLRANPSDQFETFPGIFFIGARDPAVVRSTVE